MVVFSHSNLRAVKTLRPFVFGFELAFSPLDDAGRCVYIYSLHWATKRLKMLLKIKGLCQSLSRLIFFLMQVVNPESIFLSRDNWCMWMRWNQLAKFFSLLSYLLPAGNERNQTQQSVDPG